MSNLSRRLHDAGILLPLPADLAHAPSLLRRLGLAPLLAPLAMRPALVGLDNRRLGALLKAAGARGGLPTEGDFGALGLALPLDCPLTAPALVAEAVRTMEIYSEHVLVAARHLDDPGCLPLLRSALVSTDNDVVAEGLMGIARFGDAADVARVLPLLGSDDEPTVFLALYVLERLGALARLATGGELDRFATGDNAESLQAAVEFAVEGDPGPLSELLDKGWRERVSLYRLVRAAAERGPAPDLFDVLLARGEEEDDQDAALLWSFALAAAAPPGPAGADAILDMASGLSEGGYNHAAAVAAVGRLRLEGDDRDPVVERLLSHTPDDSDARAAIRVAVSRLDPAAARRAPSSDDILVIPGYGRLEGWFGDRGGEAAPDAAWVPPLPAAAAALLQDGDTQAAAPLLALLKRNRAPLPTMTLAAVALVDRAPHAIPLLERWVEESGSPTDTRKASAAALLVTPAEVGVAPVLLRALVGADLGGPLPDDLYGWGQLLGLLKDSDTAPAVGPLLMAAPLAVRTLAAGLLDADRDGGSTRDAARLRLAVPEPPASRRSPAPPLLALAAGQAAAPGSLVEAALARPDEAMEAVATFLDLCDDRDSLRGLARDAALLGALPAEALAGTCLQLAGSDSWLKREAAAEMAGAVGEALLETSLADALSARLVELCDDDDSDVSGAARRACERLEIEA